jgi:hypothetical protein
MERVRASDREHLNGVQHGSQSIRNAVVGDGNQSVFRSISNEA